MNTFGRITTQPCVNVVPPADPRCSDPAFAIANPGICPTTSHLVIKPGFALACSLGSVQFTAVLITNGIEQDVSSDCLWQTSNPVIAVIGVMTGNATGISQGEVTISATYEDYTATSEFTVLAASGSSCCSTQRVAMMMLVDTSKSMSQAFGSSYTTRLKYAQAAAGQFASEVNDTKDTIGLITFNDSLVSPVDSLTSDKASVEADCALISQTQKLTSFYDAFEEAITELNAADTELRVIVLFSDGEDTSEAAGNGYVGFDNPLELLSDFKANGGIVICMGCRASGGGFALLSAFSTGGFFVNAYPDTEDDALTYLSGLKGYICAGNCAPTGDAMVSEGALNYTGFINWDVTGGTVDLFGNGFFDVFPGNGMYVDLSGSGYTSPSLGRLVSKVTYSITSGHQYRLSAKLAANPFKGGGPYSALLKVFYMNGTDEIALLEQTVVINGASADFLPYSFAFTSPATVSAYISIQEVAIPDSTSPDCDYGMYLDSVVFKDVTDLVTLLDDNFASENQVYVPPACGAASLFVNGGYAYGYNCYGEGCLDSPPPAQSPDPNPLPDIESGYTPPEEYTSTRTACAECLAGFRNLSALSSTVVDGEATPVQFIVIELAEAAAIQAFSLTSANTTNATLTGVTLYGSTDGTTWDELFSTGTIQLYVNDTPYFPSVDNTTEYLYFKLEATGWYPSSNILASAGFTVYGTSDTICEEATATGSTPAEADKNAYDAALALADAQLNCQPFYTATEVVTLSCPQGTYGNQVSSSATRSSFSSQEDAQAQAIAAATALAQAEIDDDCTSSNNEETITIADAPASGIGIPTPFPSVKSVTGQTGVIAGMSVEIYGLSHTWPSDIEMFLRHPDGTCVGLMKNCGGSFTVSAIDIVFEDGNPPVPVGAPIVAGTYAPTENPATPGVWAFSPTATPTAPTPPTGFLLSALDGKTKNGSWSLWIIDVASGNSGTISGGFDITFA